MLYHPFLSHGGVSLRASGQMAGILVRCLFVLSLPSEANRRLYPLNQSTTRFSILALHHYQQCYFLYLSSFCLLKQWIFTIPGQKCAALLNPTIVRLSYNFALFLRLAFCIYPRCAQHIPPPSFLAVPGIDTILYMSVRFLDSTLTFHGIDQVI